MVIAFGSNAVSLMSDKRIDHPFTDVESFVTKSDYYALVSSVSGYTKDFKVIFFVNSNKICTLVVPEGGEGSIDPLGNLVGNVKKKV